MEIYSTAILLFLIMDPLGNMPVFISILKNVPEERRKKVLLRELLIALMILLAFLYGGEHLLRLLSLKQEAVSIAGAIILFIIAIRMIFPPGRGGIMGDTPEGEPFIVPLATPMIAGPSILATLILVTSQNPGMHFELTLAVLLSWGVSATILMCSGRLMRLLGNKGIFAIERLMGMILVMLSVQMLMDGIAKYLA